MKNLAMGICSFLLISTVILISFTLHGRNIRQTELSNALSAGMEKAMEQLSAQREFAPRNKEEWMVYFIQGFLMQIDSEGEVGLHILAADFEKGLLSAEAEMKYRHPIGSQGTINIKRIMILEKEKR